MAPWLALDFPYGELRTAEDAARALRPPQESEQLRFRVPGESRPVGLGAEISDHTASLLWPRRATLS